VPEPAEGADVLFPFGKPLKQQRLGIFPAAAAILLEVPVMGADILEEPLALVGIGNEAAIGNMRIVMDQTLPMSNTIWSILVIETSCFYRMRME